MVPIGHQPILWHVMQYYSRYGHQDFILCLGYKANVIKDYFLTAAFESTIRDLDQRRLLYFSQQNLRLHSRRRRAGA
jgi:NDP-sugar pyrophosphorylase family protein